MIEFRVTNRHIMLDYRPEDQGGAWLVAQLKLGNARLSKVFYFTKNDLVGDLRRAGFAVAVPSGWEDHDATLVGSWLILGELVTSSHPVGCVQLRVRRRLRTARLLGAAVAAAALALVSPWATFVAALALSIDVGRGHFRTGRLVRFVVEEATR